MFKNHVKYTDQVCVSITLPKFLYDFAKQSKLSISDAARKTEIKGPRTRVTQNKKFVKTSVKISREKRDAWRRAGWSITAGVRAYLFALFTQDKINQK